MCITPFSGPEPAQLRVVDELPPHRAHVGEQLLGVAADEALAQRVDGGHLDVVAAPDREDEAVPRQAVRASVAIRRYAAE